jgi:hypothetical protein
MQSSFGVGGGVGGVESGPRFKTVLSARNNDERPSGEYETVLTKTNRYFNYLTILFMLSFFPMVLLSRFGICLPGSE